MYYFWFILSISVTEFCTFHTIPTSPVQHLFADIVLISFFLNILFICCILIRIFLILAKKQNGSAFRTSSLGSGGARTPPAERKSKFSIGKLLRPWKWKRKRKSDKLEAVSRSKYLSFHPKVKKNIFLQFHT